MLLAERVILPNQGRPILPAIKQSKISRTKAQTIRLIYFLRHLRWLFALKSGK